MKNRIKTKGIHEAISNKTAYFFMVFLIIVVPIVYFNQIGDKVLLPRLLVLSSVLLMLGIYVFSKRRYSFFDLSAIKNFLALFAGLYFISIVFSFLQAYDFREGIIVFIKAFNVLLLMVFLPVLFKNTDVWFKKISTLVIIASFIALCIGYYQYFTLVFSEANKYLPDGRDTNYLVKGLMAHKNQFSISLLLQLPFLVYAIVKLKGLWRIAGIISTISILILLLILQTRSVWTALGVMILFSVITLLINYRKFGLRKIHRNTALISISILALLLSLAMFAKSDYGNVYLYKLQTITDVNAYNNTFRVKILGATVDLIKDQPILGVGAGNWKFGISDYFGDLHFEQKDFNWLRPHNDYLWVWSEMGIFGLLFYLGIFVSAFYYGIKTIRKNKNQESKLIALLLLSGILAYMIVSLFTFPLERINQQLYIGIYFAGIISLNLKNVKPNKMSLDKRIIYYPVIIILLFGIFYSYSIIKQEYHVIKAIAYTNNGNWNEVIKETQKAENPLKVLDVRALPIEYYYGMAYAGLNNHKKSIEYYSSALNASPNNITVLNNLGQEYYKIGEYKKAISYFDHALSIIPTFTESLVNISTSYYQLGRYRKSLNALKKVKKESLSDAMTGNMKALRKILKKSRNESKDRK
ncbi:MAG: tetratricopeptide repeat protein [Bacteroidota bacterium]|nr:tetratricopeptide repeat protein [Bacteroidota bacterium]